MRGGRTATMTARREVGCCDVRMEVNPFRSLPSARRDHTSCLLLPHGVLSDSPTACRYTMP